MLDATLIVRAARSAVSKPQGDLRGKPAELLAALPSARRRGFIDPSRVARYRRACQLPESPDVPIAYPETLFLSPMARLATDPQFPLSPLGLIHVGQMVRRHRPILPGDVLELGCRIARARETERGVELEIEMTAGVGGELAWEGRADLLSRNATTRAASGRRDSAAAPPTADSQVFDVSGRTGREYARASGDFNPHHLTTWTARPLGYRRPIAHGMWTLARAVGLLEQARGVAPTTVEARFKKPLYMPGRAAFRAEPAADGFAVEIFAPDSGAPHLVGTVATH